MVWVKAFPEVVPLGAEGCVAAIGNFDGVHAGHREVVREALRMSGCQGVRLPVVVLTFEPHPRVVLFPGAPLKRLTLLDEKARLLGEAGADGVAVLGFDASVAGWGADAFLDRVVVGWLNAKMVCVGENFRFGRGAEGDIDRLRRDGRFGVRVVSLLCDAGGVISSRRLREQAGHEGQQ